MVIQQVIALFPRQLSVYLLRLRTCSFAHWLSSLTWLSPLRGRRAWPRRNGLQRSSAFVLSFLQHGQIWIRVGPQPQKLVVVFQGFLWFSALRKHLRQPQIGHDPIGRRILADHFPLEIQKMLVGLRGFFPFVLCFQCTRQSFIRAEERQVHRRAALALLRIPRLVRGKLNRALQVVIATVCVGAILRLKPTR